MNPFSRYLLQWSKSRHLNEFVVHWDRLEEIMVAVHRQKMTVSEAEGAFAEVWAWLRQAYGRRWAKVLRPYWQQTKAAGEPTHVDPFQLLLDLPETAAILGNWRAMQHLPAAREALNQYILDQTR